MIELLVASNKDRLAVLTRDRFLLFDERGLPILDVSFRSLGLSPHLEIGSVMECCGEFALAIYHGSETSVYVVDKHGKMSKVVTINGDEAEYYGYYALPVTNGNVLVCNAGCALLDRVRRKVKWTVSPKYEFSTNPVLVGNEVIIAHNDHDEMYSEFYSIDIDSGRVKQLLQLKNANIYHLAVRDDLLVASYTSYLYGVMAFDISDLSNPKVLWNLFSKSIIYPISISFDKRTIAAFEPFKDNVILIRDGTIVWRVPIRSTKYISDYALPRGLDWWLGSVVVSFGNEVEFVVTPHSFGRSI